MIRFPQSSSQVLLIGGLVTTLHFGFTDCGSAEQLAPNFIVIFCDNLGYGDIEPFGSTLHRTPNLNRMAEEGRKFTHFCVTSGVCTPSRASILTACYSQRVQMNLNPRDHHVLRPVSPYGLHPDEETIAEALRDKGYATACIGKWHLGDQDGFLPTDQGFDYFYGIPYSDDMTSRVWERDGSHWPPLPLLENKIVLEAPVDRDFLTKTTTERALAWIDANHESPFFLYFPQTMPGSTSAPFASPDFKGKSQNGPWGDSIEEIDWSTGQILDQLVSLGIDDRTFVIWTSDNGAPIRPDLADLSRGSNRPLHGRGYTTAEGAFRVPTLMWWPGTVPAGTECDELATTMDLFPTFLNWARATPSSRKRDGHDIRSLVVGDEGANHPMKYFSTTISISSRRCVPVPGSFSFRSRTLLDTLISKTEPPIRQPFFLMW
ncbi:MAG: sulfatase [Verrucomicrobiota bacterium]